MNKSKSQILIEAQTEQLGEITNTRIRLLEQIADLKSMGGTDDYRESLLGVVTHHSPDGILLVDLRDAFPDQALLKLAREALKNDGKIIDKVSKESKRSTILTAVAQEPSGQTEEEKKGDPEEENEEDGGEKAAADQAQKAKVQKPASRKP